MNKKPSYIKLLLGLMCFGVLCWDGAWALGRDEVLVPQNAMDTATIEPGSAMPTRPVNPLGNYDRKLLEQRVFARRLKMFRNTAPNPIGPGLSPLLEKVPAETKIEGALADELINAQGTASSSLVFSRNVENSIGARTLLGNPLAEPSAVSEGADIFFTGNTYASYSKDGGGSWTNHVVPLGPGPIAYDCCDHDVVYDKRRGLTIWSVLYTDPMAWMGVVRIFVQHKVDADAAHTCFYDVNPSSSTNAILPDYPHLGLSNKWLYLTTNEDPEEGQIARVRRFDLDQLARCAKPATMQSFSFRDKAIGPRVLVPAEGATTTMYFGLLPNNSTFRIYTWTDAGASPTFVDRAISPSKFAKPDCRGGVGNYDWLTRETAYEIYGFRLRGAVGAGEIRFYWHSAPIGSYPQAHVRAAVFRESDKALLDQPHIWSSSTCFGYPAVTVNTLGDFGLTIGYGGKVGGGGAAAQAAAGVDDELTPGRSWTIRPFAAGTHNLPEGRYGDYLSVRRQEPCGIYFAGTGYSLKDGTDKGNINVRYVEFGRERYQKCSDGWKGTHSAP